MPNASVLVALLVAFVLAARPVSAVDGATLYRAHCARCHGPQGHGDGPDAAALAHPPRDLRDGFVARHSTDDLMARIRTGRPLPLPLDPAALAKALRDIEAVATHIRRLPTIDWPEARRGRELYLQRCEGCHGPTGEGAPAGVTLERVPPNLGDADVRARFVGDRRLLAVRHALPGMPGLQQVPTDADARALAAWVALLSPGYRLYARYCAGCHGEDGRPPTGVEAADRPTVVFDAAYLADLAPGELEDAATHMVVTKKPRMPHLAGELSESEARAIVEYLRALP